MAELAKTLSVATWAPDPALPVHRFAHDAMATTFEIIIAGEEAAYAEEAALAAFDELDGIELELSRFVETSDVSRIASLRAGESARVGIAAFDCLALAARVHAETGGAFDVTVGALAALWSSGEGPPSDEDRERAGDRTGMRMVETNEDDHSVSVGIEGVSLDLGGIGKGYALDRMAELLRVWSIERALLHSGESSVVAIGSPPGGGVWSLGLRDPRDHARTISSVRLAPGRAMSGSGRALHGSHIIDPRTSRPAEDAPGAWAVAPTAALSDALSTAFMVMSEAEVAEYCGNHPEVSAVLVPGLQSGTGGAGRKLPAGPDGRTPACFGERDEFVPGDAF